MIIGVDSNQLAKGSHEKSNRANHQRLVSMGHILVPLAIPYGDYIQITPEIDEIIKAKGDKLSKKDLDGKITISVDRKNSIDEICGNLCSNQKEHERFRNELIAAQKSNCRMFAVIENTEGIKSLDDIRKWSNPRLHRYNKINYMHRLGKWQNVKLSGQRPPCDNVRLMKTMLTCESRYKCKFVFCSPYESAQKIVELLSGEGAENGKGT